MSIRSIIVHADDAPEAAARMRAGGALAAAFGAHVEALVVSPVVHDPSASAEEHAQKTQKAADWVRAVGDEIKREFDAAVHGFHTHADRMRTDCAAAMRAADLILVGPPPIDGLLAHDDVFHAALMLSGRPCLIIPPRGAPEPFGRRIVIAWKDTKEAARAVHDALPFLERANSILLLALKPDDGPYLGQRALDRMKAALARRDLPLSVETDAHHGLAHRTLMRRAHAFNADMLVMGGFGRARMSEFLFGGMTRSILAGL
ncbi:MAG: universal stress protein, partial [Hyphomonadaceae bacterium]